MGFSSDQLFPFKDKLQSLGFCIFFLFSSEYDFNWASLVAQTVQNLPAVQETSVPSLGWKDPPGEGIGNPLRYSCVEKPIDRGAWQATVH